MATVKEYEKQDDIDFRKIISPLDVITYHTTYEKDPMDEYTLLGNKIFWWELKHRNFNHNAFRTWIFEQDKYNSFQQRKGDAWYYVNIFDDGYYAIWNVKEMDLTNRFHLSEKEYNKRTADDINDGKKVNKMEASLTLDEAMMQGYINEIGQYNEIRELL